ncbi:MlaA family lipoprotein [Marinimicrobium alkaliphilum]|uniref:MlaA family lipoprotein n=1 Tax=Marinimicrobium alkaliphilum TaxID=2202654 RepID=UPI000DBA6455|nr:VacJ family lipoprotein [Marinimicrobium alkaliphilum]
MRKRCVFLLMVFSAFLSGCSSTASHDLDACHDDSVAVDNGADLMFDIYDPMERMNRATYRFNARFDEAIHWPVAVRYRRYVPREARAGIRNAFSNLREIPNTANHILQGRLGRGVRTTGRFTLNTTLGLLGLFDVASSMGIDPAPTRFGDTLGRWGLGAGPYLVVPVLGPSNLRDGVGELADLGIGRVVNVGGIYSGKESWAMGTLLAVDLREGINFRYYESGSPFEYELLRFLYMQKRAIEVEGARARRPSLWGRAPECEPGERSGF